MKEHEKLTAVLCIVWAATLLYGEMFSFWTPSLFSCSWPHQSDLPVSNSAMDREGSVADYVKVAVIADPQLMDKTSLRLPPKSLVMEIVQFYTDLYMRRAFFASVMPFKPDVILFLGDYFDGGPYLTDEEWQESLSRFKHIFGLNTEGKNADFKVYFIPGNHDIGYASLHSHKPEVIERYEKEFGARNHRFTVGKVEFIAVDAQTLDAQGNLASASWDFISNVSKDIHSNPRVLLTHIPLYRQDGTGCGPQRSSSVINQRIVRAARDQEIMYQNYITEESSKRLLELIKPVLIFSGHDHDQCTLTHESRVGPVIEHTLGTISWQQGNLHPSFMLLAASNITLPDSSRKEEVVPVRLCFLPMQTHIYLWYLSLLILTLLTLLFWPTTGISFGHPFSKLAECSRMLVHCNMFSHGMKEKNEDENCEYEMIWGADGSMHLVKKIVETPFTRTDDRGMVERRNAVIRPTARKNINQETELSLNVDMSANVEANPLKVSSRTGKSKAKIMVQRMVRTFRMVTFIAAVNVTIYMMLLFKDWIDK